MNEAKAVGLHRAVTEHFGRTQGLRVQLIARTRRTLGGSRVAGSGPVSVYDMDDGDMGHNHRDTTALWTAFRTATAAATPSDRTRNVALVGSRLDGRLRVYVAMCHPGDVAAGERYETTDPTSGLTYHLPAIVGVLLEIMPDGSIDTKRGSSPAMATAGLRYRGTKGWSPISACTSRRR